MLFVRDAPTDDLGAAPFLCLGQVDYVDHRSKPPIAITWRLHRSLPADTFATASAGGSTAATPVRLCRRNANDAAGVCLRR